MQEIKIACISDIHNNKLDCKEMPKADILVVVSATNRGTQSDYIILRDNFKNWETNYQYIVYVPGKHDLGLQDNYWHYHAMLTEIPNVVILVNTDVRLLGLNIWGSPMSKHDVDWAYTLKGERERENVFKGIPSGTDVVVTFSPAEGILDRVKHRRNAILHVGCKYIREALERVSPQLHICGGARESHGAAKDGNTIFINASLVNEEFQPFNKVPVVSVNVYKTN